MAVAEGGGAHHSSHWMVDAIAAGLIIVNVGDDLIAAPRRRCAGAHHAT